MTYQPTPDCFTHAAPVKRPSFAWRIVNYVKQKFGDAREQYLRNRQARVDRAAFRQMLLLDDELLDDIGVTRANVEWASELPLHQSASKALDSTRKRARPRIRP